MGNHNENEKPKQKASSVVSNAGLANLRCLHQMWIELEIKVTEEVIPHFQTFGAFPSRLQSQRWICPSDECRHTVMFLSFLQMEPTPHRGHQGRQHNWTLGFWLWPCTMNQSVKIRIPQGLSPFFPPEQPICGYQFSMKSTLSHLLSWQICNLQNEWHRCCDNHL